LVVPGGGNDPCSNWTNSGTKHVVVDGDVVTDESGKSALRISLTYSGATAIDKEFTCEPGGSITETSPDNEVTPPFDIPVIDSHTIEWSHGSKNTVVENSLTLHVFEEE
jgi:hypothetical protein